MIFEIEAPNGDIFEIEGDKEPTEAELNEIYSYIQGQNTPNENTNMKVADPNASTSIIDKVEAGQMDDPEVVAYMDRIKKEQEASDKEYENKKLRQLGYAGAQIGTALLTAPLGGVGAGLISGGLLGASRADASDKEGMDFAKDVATGAIEEGVLNAISGAKLLKGTTLAGKLIKNALNTAAKTTAGAAVGGISSHVRGEDEAEGALMGSLGILGGDALSYATGGIKSIIQTFSKSSNAINSLGGVQNVKNALKDSITENGVIDKDKFLEKAISGMSEEQLKSFQTKLKRNPNYIETFENNIENTLSKVSKDMTKKVSKINSDIANNIQEDFVKNKLSLTLDQSEEGIMKYLGFGKNNAGQYVGDESMLKAYSEATGDFINNIKNYPEFIETSSEMIGDNPIIKKEIFEKAGLLQKGQDWKNLNNTITPTTFTQNAEDVQNTLMGLVEKGSIDTEQANTMAEIILGNTTDNLSKQKELIILNQLKLNDVYNNGGTAKDLSNLKHHLIENIPENVFKENPNFFNTLKESITELQDTVSPKFKELNDVYRQQNSALNAYKVGSKINTDKLTKVKEIVEQGTPIERFALENGISQKYKNAIIDRNPKEISEITKQVKNTFGENSSLYKRLTNDVKEEAKFIKNIDKLLEVKAGATSAESKISQNVIDAVWGLSKGMLLGGTRGLTNAIQNYSFNPKTQSFLNEMMTNPNFKKLNKILDKLDPLEMKDVKRAISMLTSYYNQERSVENDNNN